MNSAAKDFEECAERVQAEAVTSDERSAQTAHCQSQFAGRRKVGGGYTYYDFMQNRSFDIAGPNPTDEERRRIDQAYMEFLNAQGRDALSSDLAKRQATYGWEPFRRYPIVGDPVLQISSDASLLDPSSFEQLADDPGR